MNLILCLTIGLDEFDRNNLEYMFEKMKQLGTPRATGYYSEMFAEFYRTDRRMEKIIGRVRRDAGVGVVPDNEE